MGFSLRVDGKSVTIPSRLPLLPLRDVVIFPHMTLPLFVGRPASVAAMEEAAGGDRLLIATTQLRPETSEPALEDLHRSGTIIRILQVFRLPDGTMRVLVEGLSRARVHELESAETYVCAGVAPVTEPQLDGPEIDELLLRVQARFSEYAELSQRVPDEIRMAGVEIEDPADASFVMAIQAVSKVRARQALLEAEDARDRLLLLEQHLDNEIASLRQELLAEESYRDPFQPTTGNAKSNELGEASDGSAEIEAFDRAIRGARMPAAVTTKACQELGRLAKMPVFSPEATVTRSYLQWLLDVPWNKKTRDRRNLKEAQKLLDSDHFGLTKVKERILEHLAVIQATKKTRGPILCLVGPPGVGKTSLGRSVADAMGRQFVRISLGGVRDEAEIRGHRRTYIGSMPGRIAQAMKRAGTINPVILLDEVDKLGHDFRGDPSSALLEVLDPEQNAAFNDHYLEVDYDLSRVLFLTTANNAAEIPAPLLDRMELIQLPSYLEVEKLEIARSYLFPRQRENVGLAPEDLLIEDDALLRVVRGHTRESGVRSLERQLAAICRKTLRDRSLGELNSARVVSASDVETLLGPASFQHEELEKAGRVGIATGLAWTEAGGEILLVEVKALPGHGNLELTGKLGDTMRESARAALSYVRSNADRFKLATDFYEKIDLHVHVPQGAVPKDGPSAGTTIALAMISALTDRPTRSTVALTGEITLRGRVLPIGGLPEKAVAAHRAGVRTLLIPEGNVRSLGEIPEDIRAALKIVPVVRMEEVVRHGLGRRSPGSGQKSRKNSTRLYAA